MGGGRGEVAVGEPVDAVGLAAGVELHQEQRRVRHRPSLHFRPAPAASQPLSHSFLPDSSRSLRGWIGTCMALHEFILFK